MTDVRKEDVQDVDRAIDAIDRIAARHGTDWDSYDWDQVSRARAELVEWREHAARAVSRKEMGMKP